MALQLPMKAFLHAHALSTWQVSPPTSPILTAEGGSGGYNAKFGTLQNYRSDWSVCITRYSHPLFPTRTCESSYRQHSGTVCLRIYKHQGNFLQLPVQTTTGLFHVGGMRSRHAGCTESLAHLFLLAVLVPKAEETVEAIRIRR